MESSDVIENRTFDEIGIGECASLSRTLARDDIALFAVMSGDVNPAHLDEPYAKESMFHRIIGHGMWGAALISALLGTRLPGPGTIYLAQDLRFRKPVGIGDTVTVTVTATEKRPERHVVVFDCRCVNQRGEEVITGTAVTMAPTAKIRRAPVPLPEVRLRRHEHYRDLIARCAGLEPVATAVIDPCDGASLEGAVRAAELGLIAPVFVGPEEPLRALAAALDIDIAAFGRIATGHGAAAVREAVSLARAGRVGALMAGSLPADELLRAVTEQAGLRTARRISHVFVLDVPGTSHPVIITDAAIHLFPTLEDKRDICQNAIDFARALGVAKPRVAALSAVDTVTAKLPSTLDAAALCKMADRGQISGGLVEGPLALDQAVNAQTARDARMASAVAGDADILLAPDLEAGSMLARQLIALAGADAAGIVLGAKVPIILAGRNDMLRTRLASAAVAALLAHAQAAKPHADGDDDGAAPSR